MNRLILTIAASAMAASVAAGVLDAPSRATLRRQNLHTQFVSDKNGTPRLVKRHDSRSSHDTYLGAFITVSPACDPAALEAAGVNISHKRGDILLAQIPAAAIADVEATPGVKRISLAQPVTQKMDLVRPLTGIDKIHSGENLPQAYTGKGVLCGIVDGGFDPNHINFKREDGSSRIVQFTYFRAQQNSNELVEERYGADYIPNIDTENEESFHATHTTGIMAGSYRGKAAVGVKETMLTGRVDTVSCPFYGVAYDADIATASAYEGQLSDQYIAYGVESVLDAAYGLKQPTAINLSLGSNVGPHDGTSPICRYLDAVVSNDEVNAIVVISAGNEGDTPIALNHTFKDENDKVATCLYSIYNGQIPGYQNPRSGLVYIYSDSEEPFEVDALIYNTDRKAVAFRMPLEGKPEGHSQYWCSDADWQYDASDVVSPSFARYMTGYVGLNAEIDTDAKRYYSVIDFTTWDNVTGSNARGNYILAFEVKNGKPGQRISIYSDGSMCNFTSFGLEDYGFSQGQTDGTINDIACGYNTIIAGSYNTRDDWASVDGLMYGYNGLFNAGEMSEFTSYGTLLDGRKLPTICAPGATVISSSNEYYLDAIKAGNETRQALVEQDGRKYSWHQCIGTSMSAPVITGTVALWLEAYPELTAKEARDILVETASRDQQVSSTGNPVQWGAGKLNAYEGLKRVLALKNAGIQGVNADENRLQISNIGNGTYEILLPGAKKIEANIFSTSGVKLATAHADGDTVAIDATPLAAGIYILSVNNQSIKFVK